MKTEIQNYIAQQSKEDKAICTILATVIDEVLLNAESKVWHAHPVWFLDENPIVGFSKQKAGLRLMFWSGADFGEEKLNVIGKKFKDASIIFTSPDEIEIKLLKKWVKKSIAIQWDYKNIVKRKGELVKLK